MVDERRARPTLRCLNDDLEIDLPSLDVDLGEIDHPFLAELRRVAPTSPEGQKRILSIDHPLMFRIRVASARGATWVDEPSNIVWLCAARRRAEDSDDDAYVWFADLHAAETLLPNDDDRLRDRAEAAIRLQRGLTTELLQLVDDAITHEGAEQQAPLGNWILARVLVIASGDVQEVWCALSVQGTDGAFVSEPLRDLLFASVELHLAPALFEVRHDWPTGEVEWFEIVRLAIR